MAVDGWELDSNEGAPDRSGQSDNQPVQTPGLRERITRAKRRGRLEAWVWSPGIRGPGDVAEVTGGREKSEEH